MAAKKKPGRPAKKAADQQVLIGVRIPKDWVTRTDAIVAHMAVMGLVANRASVTRAAIGRGLDVLEAERQASVAAEKARQRTLKMIALGQAAEADVKRPREK